MCHNPIPFYWVDAFTAEPFAGNPAAVCLLESTLDDHTMQRLAAEFGLSETAFVRREGAGWRLRWFTPKAEVRLCGHATVATAAALWSQHPSLEERLTFHTLSGELSACRRGELVELNFPARPPAECQPPEGLLPSLGLTDSEAVWCGRDADDYVVLVESEERVLSLDPDFAAMASVETRGVMVTARSALPDRDFVSRFFAPRVGVDEDPVTGSAHCCLTPFWAERLGKSQLSAEQLSARRGRLQVQLLGDRVALRGAARVLVRGELLVEQSQG